MQIFKVNYNLLNYLQLISSIFHVKSPIELDWIVQNLFEVQKFISEDTIKPVCLISFEFRNEFAKFTTKKSYREKLAAFDCNCQSRVIFL